jgi:hypothetical protein
MPWNRPFSGGLSHAKKKRLFRRWLKDSAATILTLCAILALAWMLAELK